MADVPVPSIATATPDGDDTVLGVKDGEVRRFSIDEVGAGINFSNINATTNMAFNNAGVERMRITDAGNVGIGTTSPGARLDVNGNARLSNGSAFVSANSLIRQIESVAGAENQFTVGSIGFLTGSFSDNGQISFSTNAGSGNTERMRIDSAGNLAMTGGGVVDAASFRDYSNTAWFIDPANTGTAMAVAGNIGIGITAPVNNTGYGGVSVNGANGSVISMMQGAAETFRITNATGYSFINTTGATPLLIGTNGTESMRITDAGNVGIGTSLNVAGSIVQGVNTTAPTLSANNTLTFSIVDNSTLRVSVRGSDGVTRTATIALT